MPEIAVDQIFPHSFVFTADDLRDIDKRVAAFLGDDRRVTFSIECSDRLERKYDSLKSLLEFDNPASKAITQLIVSGHSVDLRKRARFLFYKETVGDPVRIWIEGIDEDAVARLRSFVENLLAKARPWYGFLAELNPLATKWFLVLVVLHATLSMAGLYVAAAWLKLTGDSRNSFMWVWSFLSAGVVFGSFSFIVPKVRNRFFPRGVFAINHGLERHRRADDMRKLVVISIIVCGILVGGSVGLVVNWIYGALKAG